MAGSARRRIRPRKEIPGNPVLTPEQRAILGPIQCRILDDARAAAGGDRGYSWPPFEPGNAARQTHGAGSLQHPGREMDHHKSGISRAALRRAADLLKHCLTSPDFPEYLTWPMFRVEVEGWTRVQAQADMVYEWMMGLPEEERYIPQTAAAQKTPMEIWLHIDAQAAKYRARLGLNPVAYAKLRVALGLIEQQQDDRIAGLAEKGSVIRQRREATVIALHADEGEGA